LGLSVGARARAILDGRGFVTPQDVKDVAHEVMRHRLILNFDAEAEGVSPDRVIDEVLAGVSVP
jgi:MoxR-like ATPase